MTARNIILGIDLNAKMKGFESAAIPSAAHHRVVKHYSSPLLIGPEPSDSLLELVMHMFSREEAEVVQHLPPLRPRTVGKLASITKRPKSELELILDTLSRKKKVLLSFGSPVKYTILPIVPGTFEMALMTPDLTTRNSWHVRFASLFEKIWDEGYMASYTKRVRSNVRYLPVSGVRDSLYAAWPADRLEEIISDYDDFAVGMCQCRMTMEFVGKGCGKPLENCVTMGSSAEKFIHQGLMRRSDASEVLDIKRQAEEHGCVTWTMDSAGGRRKGNSSCSCCGCCCHFMISMNRFNAPGLVSRPRFLPVMDKASCIKCGKCATACPMDAWSFEKGQLVLDPHRCIGCGLCVLSCKAGAISMETVADSPPQQPGWFRYFMDIVPGHLVNSFNVWLKRKL